MLFNAWTVLLECFFEEAVTTQGNGKKEINYILKTGPAK